MSQGYQAALGIDTALPVTRGFEFERCTLARSSQIVDTTGWSGTRSALATRTRRGVDTVSGVIELTPVAADWKLLLPWILGSPTPQSPFTLGESVPARTVQIDKVAAVYTYAGCYVRRATFFGRVGKPIALRLEVVARTETRASAGTFPAVTHSPGVPFLFCDTTLNLVGRSREVQEWSIVIDNHLQVSFAQATTATRIESRERTVSLQCTHPFTTDEVELTTLALEPTPATLRLQHPQATLTFDFAALQRLGRSPPIVGRDEIVCVTEAIARRTNALRELLITLT